MFAVIDCGTTMTRIYLVNDQKEIVASGRKKVGVRDTSITGSRDKLRNGVTELFFEILREHQIPADQVAFAIASGMITSEVGLIEIPHLVAPAGLPELSDGILEVADQSVLPLGRPVYFIRGVRNRYPEPVRAQNLRQVDFMRGEEVQCIGIMNQYSLPYPCNLVALSSHTKIMYINEARQIEASATTISGQFYEAMVSSTNIGKSIVPVEGEEAGGYGYEELIEIAADCVHHAGLGRTMLMPRFLQVLMKTNSSERQIFVDAAIAADDLKAFHEMRSQGYHSDFYLLYGHESRCRMYTYMLKKEFGRQLEIKSVHSKEDLDRMTVDGSIAVALERIQRGKSLERMM
ncbi:2-dehydro-3-deoxygalactonokinase [Anaerotruncus colihominis]|uniref:2-dehydro-3-deoxygalactonokinase n=1 Tax=Anaerotruncus colihominis TaxID=169435 RepID=UPI00294298B1|nr:2-dehydro-3-deoxygalactonokinase [Anaerotruncus colihominis]